MTKWILQKNLSDKYKLEAFISELKNTSNFINYKHLKYALYDKKIYAGRTLLGSENTMGVRMSQVNFYMYGYKNKRIFVPSLTTQLLVKDEISSEDAFLINVFSLQYPHPYSNTSSEFNIYVGRLIFSLLLEYDLDKKLYYDEIYYFLPFIKRINKNEYEKLVCDIKEFRILGYKEKMKLFKSKNNYEEVFSNIAHEFKYYFLKLCEQYGLIEILSDTKHNGGKLFKFRHGSTNTYRSDGVIGNKAPGYIKLTSSVENKVRLLLKNHSLFEKVYGLKDYNNNKEWILDLYQYNMESYLNTIKVIPNEINGISKKLKRMVQESRYGGNDGKSFEQSIYDVCGHFRELADLEHLSGAGDTDILLNISYNNKVYNYNIEAKKTINKVTSLNASRLSEHIFKNNSEATIVIANSFSPGAIRDIKNSKIVALESESFSNYCYKNAVTNNDGLIDIYPLLRIVMENLGNDITEKVEQYIIYNYGVR